MTGPCDNSATDHPKYLTDCKLPDHPGYYCRWGRPAGYAGMTIVSVTHFRKGEYGHLEGLIDGHYWRRLDYDEWGPEILPPPGVDKWDLPENISLSVLATMSNDEAIKHYKSVVASIFGLPYERVQQAVHEFRQRGAYQRTLIEE